MYNSIYPSPILPLTDRLHIRPISIPQTGSNPNFSISPTKIESRLEPHQSQGSELQFTTHGPLQALPLHQEQKKNKVGGFVYTSNSYAQLPFSLPSPLIASFSASSIRDRVEKNMDVRQRSTSPYAQEGVKLFSPPILPMSTLYSINEQNSTLIAPPSMSTCAQPMMSPSQPDLNYTSVQSNKVQNKYLSSIHPVSPAQHHIEFTVKSDQIGTQIVKHTDFSSHAQLSATLWSKFSSLVRVLSKHLPAYRLDTYTTLDIDDLVGMVDRELESALKEKVSLHKKVEQLIEERSTFNNRIEELEHLIGTTIDNMQQEKNKTQDNHPTTNEGPSFGFKEGRFNRTAGQSDVMYTSRSYAHKDFYNRKIDQAGLENVESSNDQPREKMRRNNSTSSNYIKPSQQTDLTPTSRHVQHKLPRHPNPQSYPSLDLGQRVFLPTIRKDDSLKLDYQSTNSIDEVTNPSHAGADKVEHELETHFFYETEDEHHQLKHNSPVDHSIQTCACAHRENVKYHNCDNTIVFSKPTEATNGNNPTNKDTMHSDFLKLRKQNSPGTEKARLNKSSKPTAASEVTKPLGLNYTVSEKSKQSALRLQQSQYVNMKFIKSEKRELISTPTKIQVSKYKPVASSLGREISISSASNHLKNIVGTKIANRNPT